FGRAVRDVQAAKVVGEERDYVCSRNVKHSVADRRTRGSAAALPADLQSTRHPRDPTGFPIWNAPEQNRSPNVLLPPPPVHRPARPSGAAHQQNRLEYLSIASGNRLLPFRGITSQHRRSVRRLCDGPNLSPLRRWNLGDLLLVRRSRPRPLWCLYVDLPLVHHRRSRRLPCLYV